MLFLFELIKFLGLLIFASVLLFIFIVICVSAYKNIKKYLNSGKNE